MNLKQWCFWKEPYFRDDPSYREEEAWLDQYVTPENACGAFALEHARLKIAESNAAVASLDAKVAGVQTLAGTLSTMLTAAVAAFHLPVSLAGASLLCFLGAMVVTLFARRSLIRPASANIRQVLERTVGMQDPQAWLAASLHCSDAGAKVLQEWTAQQLWTATVLIITGVVCFFPMVLALGSRG